MNMSLTNKSSLANASTLNVHFKFLSPDGMLETLGATAF